MSEQRYYIRSMTDQEVFYELREVAVAVGAPDNVQVIARIAGLHDQVAPLHDIDKHKIFSDVFVRKRRLFSSIRVILGPKRENWVGVERNPEGLDSVIVTVEDSFGVERVPGLLSAVDQRFPRVPRLE